MLRLAFIFIVVAIGAFYAAQGPFYALLLYLWNAYFRPDYWVWAVDTVRFFNLSLLIGIYLVGRTLFSSATLRLDLRTSLILLFLVQACVSTAVSENPPVSLAFLTDFAKVLVVSYLIVVLVTDARRLRLTLMVVGLSLGFECAKQGWVNLIRSPGARNDNSIAFLGDNNGVALGTMMLVPILVALAQTATSKWEKLAFQFVMVGVFLRGITTYSRGGFLAAAVLGVFTFIRSERKIRALIGVAALTMLMVAVMPHEFWDRMQTIEAPEEDQDNSVLGRLHFWGVAVDMADGNPLTGIGPSAFLTSYRRYDPSGDFGKRRATHSVWFGVLAEMGYPGLALLIANLAMAVLSCWQVHRQIGRDPSRRHLLPFANALITSFAAFAIAGTFLSQQYNEMFWHFIGLATALRYIALQEPSSELKAQPAASPGTAASRAAARLGALRARSVVGRPRADVDAQGASLPGPLPRR